MRLLIGLLAMAALAGGAAADTPSATALDLIVRLDRAGPLDKTKIEAILGVTLTCDGVYCNRAQARVGDLKIGNVDHRGSLLILSDFSVCIPPGELTARYAITDPPWMGCTDGYYCWTYRAKRPWGRLSIGLGENIKAPCVESVVFNSHPD